MHALGGGRQQLYGTPGAGAFIRPRPRVRVRSHDADADADANAAAPVAELATTGFRIRG